MLSPTEGIDPNKVTKPIQLLAAWLVGLIAINAIALGAALKLPNGSWERGFLVVASVLNVPAFLGAMFRLQTKFRAELQDDTHYSQYLNKKTSAEVTIQAKSTLEARVVALEGQFTGGRVESGAGNGDASDSDDAAPSTLDWSQWRVALNDHLPNFQGVRRALKDAKIPLVEIFGEAHQKDSERPENWVVSLNRAMPFSYKLAMLRLLAPFGLDGFQYWTPVRNAGETEDVYIGSYGVTTYTPFSSALDELLARDIELADLEHFRSVHRVRKVP